MDVADLVANLSDPQTTLMILCNPHNRPGMIWDRSTLARVGALCETHQVLVLSDEIHCDLTVPGRSYVPFASVSEACARNSITCVAPSKAFNLAGLQTSAVVIPDPALRNRVGQGLANDGIGDPSVFAVEGAVAAAEEEFGVEQGRTLLMAALESPRGILNAYEICAASERMFGVAISGGDLRKCLQTSPTRDGVYMLAARGQVILAARAAGIQCFDTVFTDLDDQEGFEAEVLQNKAMGFDGKSLINPKQIRFVHQVFAPTEKEVLQAEKILRAYREQSAAGVGVFTVDGKMIDIAFIPGAERTLKLARACGMYDGEV